MSDIQVDYINDNFIYIKNGKYAINTSTISSTSQLKSYSDRAEIKKLAYRIMSKFLNFFYNEKGREKYDVIENYIKF